MASPKPRFFSTPAKFRDWLKANHDTATELLVGFYRRKTSKPSMTWQESVDEVLCFGWIDGVRRTIDAYSYSIRFTPRRMGSVWSSVNVARVRALTEAGRMHASGLAAFAAANPNKSKVYSYEQKEAELDDASRELFQLDSEAWLFFEAQPPSYRKRVSWWVIGAKKEETRRTRLEKLIAASSKGRRLE
jgi:uncharacterized protein YdeI (YjbR/CyaY-like superfamily)